MDVKLLNDILNNSPAYIVLALMGYGIRRVWADAWPWFRDVYWPSREQRWKEQFQASYNREQAFLHTNETFLVALRDFQNGFSKTNAESHKEILVAIKTLRESVNQANTSHLRLTEMLMERLESTDK